MNPTKGELHTAAKPGIPDYPVSINITTRLHWAEFNNLSPDLTEKMLERVVFIPDKQMETAEQWG